MWIKDFAFDFVKEKDTFLPIWEEFLTWANTQGPSVLKVIEGLTDKIKQAKAIDRLQKPAHVMSQAPTPALPSGDRAYLLMKFVPVFTEFFRYRT